MQAEQVTVPEYSYAKADFLTTVPYDKLFELHDLPFLYEQAKVKLEENALAVGFRQFKKCSTSMSRWKWSRGGRT